MQLIHIITGALSVINSGHSTSGVGHSCRYYEGNGGRGGGGGIRLVNFMRKNSFQQCIETERFFRVFLPLGSLTVGLTKPYFQTIDDAHWNAAALSRTPEPSQRGSLPSRDGQV